MCSVFLCTPLSNGVKKHGDHFAMNFGPLLVESEAGFPRLWQGEWNTCKGLSKSHLFTVHFADVGTQPNDVSTWTKRWHAQKFSNAFFKSSTPVV